MKKIFLILILILIFSCSPTYRILTTDNNYTPEKLHKYIIVNIKTGKIDTIYDYTYFSPGKYINLRKDTLLIKRIIE